MGTSYKRCFICGKTFIPHPRTAKIQKVCFKDSCRKARVQRNFQRWVKLNPNYQSGRKAKVRAWVKTYPNYWQDYRKNNSDYAARDNKRRAIAMRRARYSAKQITIDRRIDGIMDYLFWTVQETCSAKQINVDLVGAPG